MAGTMVVHNTYDDELSCSSITSDSGVYICIIQKAWNMNRYKPTMPHCHSLENTGRESARPVIWIFYKIPPPNTPEILKPPVLLTETIHVLFFKGHIISCEIKSVAKV